MITKTQGNLLLLFWAILYSINVCHSLNIKLARKWLVSSGMAVLSIGLPSSIGFEARAIDALDAATREMFRKSEKVVIDRTFDALPESAKKRRALALCKEDKLRRAAGYSSTSECNSQVLAGNFAIVTASPGQEAPSPAKAKSAIVGASGGSAVPLQSEKRQKVNDLSDLSIAQKKRRALAACKRVEVRKFAGAGSESKCSGEVNRGNYDKVIEALEYGI